MTSPFNCFRVPGGFTTQAQRALRLLLEKHVTPAQRGLRVLPEGHLRVEPHG